LKPIDDGYEGFFGEQRLLTRPGWRPRERLASPPPTLTSTMWSSWCTGHGGLAWRAHDRRSFGAIGQLGLFPPAQASTRSSFPRVPAAPSARPSSPSGLPISTVRAQPRARRRAHRCHLRAAAFDGLALAVRGLEGRSIGDA
jgi:hypothetical protein